MGRSRACAIIRSCPLLALVLGCTGAAKAYGEGQANQRHSQQGGGACDGVVDGGGESCARVGQGADRSVGQRRNRERQPEPEQQDTWQHVQHIAVAGSKQSEHGQPGAHQHQPESHRPARAKRGGQLSAPKREANAIIIRVSGTPAAPAARGE